jgi:hypothetical protein
MHYSIKPAAIRTEIGKLGHTVTNIWDIKQKSHFAPSFNVFCGVETCPEQQGYIPCRIPPAVQNQILNLPSTNGILLNAQTVKDTDTQSTAISNHDASNAQVITPHSTVTERNAR